MRLYRRAGSELWWLDFRAGGKRFRESSGFANRDLASNRLAARHLEEVAKTSSSVPQGHYTLTQALALYRNGGQGRARWGDEMKRVERFVNWVGTNRWQDPTAVSRWLTWLQTKTGGGVSPTTARRYRTSLGAFFRWGRAIGVFPLNPVEGSLIPPDGSRKKRGLKLQEASRVLERLGTSPLGVAYALAFYAGMRRSEITSARWEHIDWNRRTILVPGTKTADSEATLPLHDELRVFLEPLRQTAGPICRNQAGGPYHPSSLENLRRDRNDAGLTLPPFHLARHTLATVLLEAGADIYEVSRLLRHKSVRTTEEFYGWCTPASRRSALDRLSLKGAQQPCL